MSTISIIGSGDVAVAIGGLAAKAGPTVEVMSRDAAKVRALAEQIGAGATTGTYGAALAGDVVILAVPYSAVLDVVKQYGEALAGKLLVDITNPAPTDAEVAKVLTPTSPTPWPTVRPRATRWTCSSPGTASRRRYASRRSSKTSDCARWTLGRCLWLERWSSTACCRWAP
ncbi:NADPH-dependent F420 reductase [Pseudomonas frederiksbergensis]|uniref:NADPH-dependent F420 reductase n=1 Tax=Pseudomonas frederiksbergensis TaxID=104087 RepID=UPI001FE78F93|nr:NAD(P)-binding domain-containing protein [Pseudomonas frederiksbergensis]